MPTVASLEALERAAAGFEIGDTRLVIEPPALTEATVPQRPWERRAFPRGEAEAGTTLTARAYGRGQAGRTSASRQ